MDTRGIPGRGSGMTHGLQSSPVALAVLASWSSCAGLVRSLFTHTCLSLGGCGDCGVFHSLHTAQGCEMEMTSVRLSETLPQEAVSGSVTFGFRPTRKGKPSEDNPGRSCLPWKQKSSGFSDKIGFVFSELADSPCYVYGPASPCQSLPVPESPDPSLCSQQRLGIWVLLQWKLHDPETSCLWQKCNSVASS